MDHKSQVELLLKKFRAAASDYKFPDKLDLETQKYIYDNTVDEPHHVWFRINLEYQIRFLKGLIEQAENSEYEAYEKMYVVLGDLMESEDEDTQYRHYLMEGTSRVPRLMIEESKYLISNGTTGARTWEAASVLAEWCVADTNMIKGKKIVELGCGTGLTGLTILNLTTPKKYTFTDGHRYVVDILSKNLELNLGRMKLRLKKAIQLVEYDWNEFEKFRNADWVEPDMVIASDVVFDLGLFFSLINTLKGLLKKPESFAVFAITVRNPETVDAFLKRLDENGLKWKNEQPVTPRIFLPSSTTVRLIRITSD